MMHYRHLGKCLFPPNQDNREDREQPNKLSNLKWSYCSMEIILCHWLQDDLWKCYWIEFRRWYEFNASTEK
ncbi:Inter-alpha-trypsin inhibitor heavy chain H5 [Frankliniella fusca]|uniref:Inter-alpha-trypsin inhibitor heavy chain H5 n=1 Tax=Frankliniella fusca TaxID=407009 RepID=A0AAE1HKB6_9NEOP|nr:Inter-alpha-trypsin inhibitor heavy chain H5 [Frankliniella fusca]